MQDFTSILSFLECRTPNPAAGGDHHTHVTHPTPCTKLMLPPHLLCCDYNCDSTTIRLRSDYDVSRALASIRREQKMNMSFFRRSCIVVVQQSNRAHIVISITFVVVECVVISSYRSRIVVESHVSFSLATALLVTNYILQSNAAKSV